MSKVFHWKFDKIIRDVAIRTDVPANDVREAVWAQFKAISDTIKSCDPENPVEQRIYFLGTFIPKKLFIDRKIYYYDKRKIRMKKKLENIIEGWTNVIFPNERAEQIARARAAICAPCIFNEGNVCTKCSCPLSAKTRATGDHCPIGKW